MGKLDIISFSGLNHCGTGRDERFFFEDAGKRLPKSEKL